MGISTLHFHSSRSCEHLWTRFSTLDLQRSRFQTCPRTQIKLTKVISLISIEEEERRGKKRKEREWEEQREREKEEQLRKERAERKKKEKEEKKRQEKEKEALDKDVQRKEQMSL